MFVLMQYNGFIEYILKKKKSHTIAKLCQLTNIPQISLLVKRLPKNGKNLAESLRVKGHSNFHILSIGIQVEKGHTLLEVPREVLPEQQVRKVLCVSFTVVMV